MSNRKRRVREVRPAGSTGLLLFRHPGERIVLGGGPLLEEIGITVCKIRGGGVEIGIKAPQNVIIMREETIGPQETR